MRSALPPLDLHAHVDPSTPEDDLRILGAVIFAATRSLPEADSALRRRDTLIVWGVGSHPGVTSSHRSFDAAWFRSLIERTVFVSEFGLDGGAKVPLDQQLQTLRGALDVLVNKPRIISLHSYRATGQLLDVLSAQPVPGVVLHWWLGSVAATKRAVGLGCYFSVNAAMFRRPGVLRHIPLNRLLTETDHPYGDRTGPRPHQPGNVLPVEYAIAKLHGLEPEEVRRSMWRNLNRLVVETGCSRLLSRQIRSYLIAGTEP
ncbi:TatD family hydrolase [Frankia sp. Mgl5]|uniref:TatD family hydrolase n=1 Tax=Frankia sp. Mgl5 TaxID=2933793 RepID=UPI0020358220|nr:TatD family hydrolase [Frankia sp. Mgl5]MCK9928834.1 TatD family hydrolase [Frankia sp. Mgl5]